MNTLYFYAVVLIISTGTLKLVALYYLEIKKCSEYVTCVLGGMGSLVRLRGLAGGGCWLVLNTASTTLAFSFGRGGNAGAETGCGGVEGFGGGCSKVERVLLWLADIQLIRDQQRSTGNNTLLY